MKKKSYQPMLEKYYFFFSKLSSFFSSFALYYMQGFVNVYFKYHAYYLFIDLSYSRRREEKIFIFSKAENSVKLKMLTKNYGNIKYTNLTLSNFMSISSNEAKQDYLLV